MADSKRAGIPLRNFSITNSFFTPMTLSYGPVMPNICNIGRALWQHGLVRGGNMRVRADHRGDAPFEIPAESDLFRAGLGMKIYKHDFRFESVREADRRSERDRRSTP
jgi:hypothetical protein